MVTFDARSPDLIFPSEELNLWLLRDGDGRAVQGGYGPADAGQPVDGSRGVPITLGDFSSGMGASQAGDGDQGLYSYGTNVCTRWPRVVMPAGLATEISVTVSGATEITSSVEQDGHLYLLAGRYALKIANGTASATISTADQDLGAAFLSADAVNFDGNAYVGGTGGFIWKLATGGTWSQSADTKLKHLATVYWEHAANGAGGFDTVGSERLVGTDVLSVTSPTTFRHVPAGSDPKVLANYSSAIKVGDTSFPITSIAAANRHVWFCTQGGVADVMANGYSPILNPYFKQQFDVLNGAVSMYLGGLLFVSHVQGLDRVDVSGNRMDAPDWVMPGAGRANETPIYGRVSAMTTEAGWVVASVYNGTDSYVVYGRESGPRGMDWHGAELVVTGERVSHLRVASKSPGGSSQPCIWVCSVTGAGAVKLRWLSIPKAASPLQELLNNLSAAGVYTGTHRWATSWSLTLSDLTWGDERLRKILTGYFARADRLTSATYLKVFARKEAGAYAQQGSGDPSLAIMRRSPRSELLSVETGIDRTTQGHTIGLRLDGVGTSTTPAVLREFTARALLRPELLDTRHYRILLGAAQSQRNTTTFPGDPARTYARLVALQTREPLDLKDEMGVTRKVTVNPGIQYREVALKNEGPNKVERLLVAELEVTIVPTSSSELALDQSGDGDTTPPASNVAVYDSGDVYNGGKTWG